MIPTSWTISDWSAFIGALAAVLGALGYLGRLYLRNGYATKAELADHHKRLTGLAQRMDNVEAQSASMATRDDVNKVLVAIERADGDRRALAAEVAGVKELLSAFQKPLFLIQEALMQPGAPR